MVFIFKFSLYNYLTFVWNNQLEVDFYFAKKNLLGVVGFWHYFSVETAFEQKGYWEKIENATRFL